MIFQHLMPEKFAATILNVRNIANLIEIARGVKKAPARAKHILIFWVAFMV